MAGRGWAAGWSVEVCWAIDWVRVQQRVRSRKVRVRNRPMLHYKPAMSKELLRERGHEGGIIEVWVKPGTLIQLI